MTTTQHAPIGRTDTAPTAPQKVVAAMWTIGKPTTAKAIAEAAELGYSTVTPILRNLLADNQAVKTESTTGPAEWQLTATLPNPPATATTTPNDGDDGDGDDADEPGSPGAVSASGPDDAAPDDSGTEPASDAGTDSDDNEDGDNGGSEPDLPAGDDPAPQESTTAEQGTSRTYRKPVHARRPKGHLRAAVLAVLDATPQRAFKVSEVCKAIDAANTDGSSNKAGAGAVANALDKLINSGDAVRVEDATVATYQSARTGA